MENVEIRDKDEQQTEEQQEGGYTVIFEKPYTFEKKVYPSVDLAALDTLTAADLFAAEAYAKRKGGSFTVAETSTPYLLYLAAKAAELPIEFMENLPIKDASRVKYAAMLFFQ